MRSTSMNSVLRFGHLAQGAPLSAFAMMYNQVLSFGAGILIARVIGAADYGVTNLARNILDILAIASPLGLDLALQRHFGAASGRRSARLAQLQVFRSMAFVVGIAPALLAAFGFGAVIEQSIFQYPEFANVLLVALLALPFVTDLALLGGAYRGVLQPAPSILVSNILQPTCRALVIAALFAFGWRLWAVIVGTSVSFAISWLALAVHARKDLVPIDLVHRRDWTDIRSVFRYSPSLAASLILFTWIRTADLLFLGHFGTAADVGQYGVAIMLAQLIGLLGLALGQTLGARIAECHRNNNVSGMESLLAANVRWTSLACAPIFAAIVFWGDRIDLALGPSFAVAAPVITIVATRALLHGLLANSSYALSMTGSHLYEAAILLIGAVVSVVVCLVLIPSYGEIGAALAGLIAFSTVNLARCAMISSMFGIRHVNLSVAKPVVWALMVAWLTSLCFKPIDYRTLSSTVCEVVIFLTLFVVSGWFLLTTEQDREAIFAVFRPARDIERLR